MAKLKDQEVTIDVEPTVEGQIVVREETALTTLPADGSVSAQAAMAMIELSRREGGQIDIETLRELRGMAKELRDEERLQWFSRDMASAQADMQPVVRAAEVRLSKPGEADKGGYKYASLEDIDKMLRPIMTRYGFSVTYDRAPRGQDGGGYVVTGSLWHRSGHFLTASFSLSLDSGPGRSNAQAAGSTDAYGRKYILLGFFNIVRKNEDDDGVAAGGSPISLDEAAQVKKLVDEAGIGDGLEGSERTATIVEWFNDMLGYALPKGYASIRQEDGLRVRRALLSVKAKRLTTKEAEVKI